MIQIAPPCRPPCVGLDDSHGAGHVRLRLWQWSYSLIICLITAWLISLGPIPGIIAVVTAKHVLVAIFVMGIGVDSRAPGFRRRYP